MDNDIVSCSIPDRNVFILFDVFVIYSFEIYHTNTNRDWLDSFFSIFLLFLLLATQTHLCAFMWVESEQEKMKFARKHKNVNTQTQTILILFFHCISLFLCWSTEKSYARQLDDNAVMHLDDISLAQLKSLRALRLEGNMLQRVPTEALTGLPTLEILWVCLSKAIPTHSISLSLIFSISFRCVCNEMLKCFIFTLCVCLLNTIFFSKTRLRQSLDENS